MGTEAVWVPYVTAAIAAAGAGASYYNTQKTAKKQDNALAAQLRDQAEKQRQADARTNELVQKTAQSDATDEKASALDSFVKQIRAQQGNVTRGLNVKGAVSDEYRQDAQDAALGATDYGMRVSELMSRIDAPTQQRRNEALEKVNFGDDLSRLKRASAGNDFLHQMRLRGIRRNPWIDAGAAAASSAASAYGQSGGWGGGGGAPSTTFASGFGNNTGWLTGGGY